MYPQRVLTVKYENLCENPLETIKSVCNFASIDYHYSMINSGGVILPSFARHQKYTNKRPHNQRKHIWKMSLKKYEINHFTAVNFDLLNLLRYDTKSCEISEIVRGKRIILRIVGIVKVLYGKRKFQKRLYSLLK